MKLDFDERDRRSVVGDLESPDEEVRRLAVERMAALPLEEGVLRLGMSGDGAPLEPPANFAIRRCLREGSIPPSR